MAPCWHWVIVSVNKVYSHFNSSFQVDWSVTLEHRRRTEWCTLRAVLQHILSHTDSLLSHFQYTNIHFTSILCQQLSSTERRPNQGQGNFSGNRGPPAPPISTSFITHYPLMIIPSPSFASAPQSPISRKNSNQNLQPAAGPLPNATFHTSQPAHAISGPTPPSTT